MKNSILFQAVCLVFAAFAFQKCALPKSSGASTRYEKAYQNRLEPGSKFVAADAVWTLEKTPDGRFIFKEYFFDTGQKTHYRECLDKECNTPHGLQKYWSDEGALQSEGHFLNGKTDGVWSYFHEKTGKISSQGIKRNDFSVGEWNSFRANGTLESTYFFGDSSQLEGQKTFFDAQGEQQIRREFYKKNRLVRAEPPIEKASNEIELFSFVEKMPAFPGGEIALLQFIAKSLNYPVDARNAGIQGRVIAKFVVEKDGSISNIEIPRGRCFSIKNECIRVIESMPRWSPGQENGRPVRLRMNIPIIFKLN